MSSLNYSTYYWSWYDFCGTTSSFRFWNPVYNDLDVCFQYLCLHIPVLSVIAILSAYYSGFQVRYLRRRLREIWILRLRCVISLFLFVLPIVRTYIEVSVYPGLLHAVDYLVAAVDSFAWLIHFSYVIVLNNRLGPSLRGPVIIGVFWALNFILSCILLRSHFIINKNPYNILYLSHIPLIFCVIQVCLHICYLLTLIPSEDLRTSNFTPVNNEGVPSTEYLRFGDGPEPIYLGTAAEGSSFLSMINFSWVTPLLNRGKSGKIDSCDDLFDLPNSLTSGQLYMALRSGLTKGSLYGTRRVTLLRALHSAFWKQFYSIGILRFAADVSGFFGPLFLHGLISFIENKDQPLKTGYFYALGLLCISSIGAICDPQFNYQMSLVGLKIRGALIATIYYKILAVNSITLSTFSQGEIINFMSTDTDRIVNSCSSFHAFWSIPLRLFVTLYLLYQQIGISFLAGLLFSIVLIPVNKFIASKIGSLSTKMMLYKDKRIFMMTEILKGIRAIKLYVWESVFYNKVCVIRQKELKYLGGRKFLDALCVYFWASTPALISVLTFSFYVYLGNQLKAPVVFTSMALLNMLVSPLNAFPWVLNGLVEAWISLQRVQSLLNLPEQDVEEYYSGLSESTKSGEIIINNGFFHWRDDNSLYLHSVNLVAKQGNLIGITGPVGSGKSTLLLAVLAEIEKSSGTVLCCDTEIGFGYVAQKPWLLRGTIRSNILFGEAFDSRKYNQVIEACALSDDFDNLVDGDLTTVGEGGSTLSGGQRARITLARAVYKDVYIYLLDDVFAAVDTKVAKHIFNYCIMGLLKSKTRIICTHQSKFLINADWIISLKEGKIINQGVPSAVLTDYEEIITDTELGLKEPYTEPDILEVETENETIVDEEERASGSLELSVYYKYISSIGITLAVLIILSITCMQASRNLVDWWLAQWISLNSTKNTSLPFSPFTQTNYSASWYLEVYLGLASANSFLTLLRAFLFALGGLVAAKTLHTDILSSIFSASCIFFDVTPLGQIINRFSSDVYTVDDSLPFSANILLAQFFTLIGSLVMTLYGLPWLCLLLAPLVPIYHWLQNHYRLTSREIKRLSSVGLSPLYNHFTETIQGLVTIRAFRSCSRFKRDAWCYLEFSQKAQLCASAIAQWLSLRLQLIGVTLISGVAFFAVVQHGVNAADPGLIGLSLSYALMVTGSLNGVISSFTETEREMVAVERIEQYLKHDLTSPLMPQPTVPVPFAWPPLGLVRFENVSLRYRNDFPLALNGVSFETRPAEKVGIVGRTGSGKSSLIAALFRLTDITIGEITIDSINIYNITTTQLRTRMGVIPQEAFVFKGTIRENMDPEGEKSDAEIWTALNRAHLQQTISALSNGLDTVIDSQFLSVGQQQLLSLARVILTTPKIVCIDEATANVDEETDLLIQQSIRNSFRQTTVLTIAHRISTILDYDRVIVMADGRILEFDDPNSLLQDPSSQFFQLVNGNLN